MPNPTPILDLVLDHMAREGLRPPELEERCAPHISRAQLYKFLAGQSDLTTARLAVLVDAMGLRIKLVRK